MSETAPPVETTIPEVVIEAKKPEPATAQPNVNSVRSPNDGVPQSGGRLWMRKWKLSIGPNSGQNSADLSRFDFEFSIQQAQYQPPWKARIRIWNLGDDVIDRLADKQYTKINLDAGYQSPSKQYGNLFAGEIGYFKHGRANATDTFVEIYASTNDTAINATVVNTWLKQGWTTLDAVKACVAVMGPHGIVLGDVPSMNDRPQPRGRLLFGRPDDIIRDIARTEKLNAFYDNQGRLQFLRDGEILALGSEIAPILNVNTGLIDIPIRTLDGAIEVTSLLNPAIKPGTQIHVDNKSTTQFDAVRPDNFIDDGRKLTDARLVFKADGFYPVGSVKHEGQTRGNSWFTHIVTQKALQQPAPPSPTLGG